MEQNTKELKEDLLKYAELATQSEVTDEQQEQMNQLLTKLDMSHEGAILAAAGLVLPTVT